MPSEYNNVITAIETFSAKDKEFKIQFVENCLLEEKMKSKRGMKSSGGSGRSTSESTFLTCFNCGKRGHKKQDCRSKRNSPNFKSSEHFKHNNNNKNFNSQLSSNNTQTHNQANYFTGNKRNSPEIKLIWLLVMKIKKITYRLWLKYKKKRLHTWRIIRNTRSLCSPSILARASNLMQQKYHVRTEMGRAR